MTRALIRLIAALVTLAWFAPSLVAPLPAAADGACNFSASNGCITTNGAYDNKKCVSGEGEDCITCDAWPGAVCTWDEGGEDLEDYCDQNPCPV